MAFQSMNQFPDTSQFADPECLEWRICQAPKRKDIDRVLESFTVNFFVALPQRDPQPFTTVTVHWGKENNQSFWGLLDAASELMLSPRDPKPHCGPPVKVGSYGGEMISGILAEVQFTVGSLGPWTHPMVMSPVPDTFRVARTLTLVPWCGVSLFVVRRLNRSL